MGGMLAYFECHGFLVEREAREGNYGLSPSVFKDAQNVQNEAISGWHIWFCFVNASFKLWLGGPQW